MRDIDEIAAEAERILRIDEYRLDQEWLGQPILYFRWARDLAESRSRVDAAKAELDLVEAEVARAVRADPAEFGVEKTTEASVHAAVLQSKRYQAAARELNAVKYHAGVVQAAVDALDHRKKALESFVYLHGQNYFSAPRAPAGEAGEGVRNAERMATRRPQRRSE